MQINDLAGLLEKEMDRKEFLRTLIIGCLAVTGIGTFVKVLTATTKPSNKPKIAATTSSSYGGSAYGR